MWHVMVGVCVAVVVLSSVPVEARMFWPIHVGGVGRAGGGGSGDSYGREESEGGGPVPGRLPMLSVYGGGMMELPLGAEWSLLAPMYRDQRYAASQPQHIGDVKVVFTKAGRPRFGRRR